MRAARRCGRTAVFSRETARVFLKAGGVAFSNTGSASSDHKIQRHSWKRSAAVRERSNHTASAHRAAKSEERSIVSPAIARNIQPAFIFVFLKGVELSMPSVVEGRDYAMYLCGVTAAECIRFTTEAGDFRVSVAEMMSPAA